MTKQRLAIASRMAGPGLRAPAYALPHGAQPQNAHNRPCAPACRNSDDISLTLTETCKA